MRWAYKTLVFFFVSFLFGQEPGSCALPETNFSIAALTWNIGNKTAPDDVVQDFVAELERHQFPDVIIVGTQEELAKKGNESTNKLLRALEKKGHQYSIAAWNGHLSSAGLGKTGKKVAFLGAQTLSVSQSLNLQEQRASIAVLLKNGMQMNNIKTRIDYPAAEKVNNSFIVVEGTVFKGGVSLPVSVASVHLNSFSDAVRRSHANVFLSKQGMTNTPKTYKNLLSEAKRFHLVMGDFNERDYLMKDNSVVDRGRLTNFVGYGYDFTQVQGKESFVYGTYGFTRLNNREPEKGIKDPRSRKHNARGGFLDRIAVATGLLVEADAKSYGAVTKREKFKPTPKIIFYAGSDHLPVMRFFTVNVPNNSQQDQEIVKRYIEKRLPDFRPEIEAITNLAAKSNPGSLMFYDSKESPDSFLKDLLNRKSLRTADVQQELIAKKKELEALQGQVETLRTTIENTHNPEFLVAVYNEITQYNQNRNLALEKMDDDNIPVSWYFPNSLSQKNFEDYQKMLEELTRGTPETAIQVFQKNEPIQKQGRKLSNSIEKARAAAANKVKSVSKEARGILKAKN